MIETLARLSGGSMGPFVRSLAVCAAVALFGAAPVANDDVTQALAVGPLRNEALQAYTFDLHVSVLVHTFPALRFHLDGVGSYERPHHVQIRFTHVPWFGKGFEKVDLAALEPSEWPQTYDVSVSRRDRNVTEVSLHDRKKSALSEAHAVLDAKAGLRQMVWKYDYGGRIQLDVTPKDVEGFDLPATEDAEIVMPHIKATAHAEFTNYHVVSDSAAR
jgi:hypothetical protein